MRGCLMVVVGFIGLLLTFCGSMAGGGVGTSFFIGTLVIIALIATVGKNDASTSSKEEAEKQAQEEKEAMQKISTDAGSEIKKE